MRAVKPSRQPFRRTQGSQNTSLPRLRKSWSCPESWSMWSSRPRHHFGPAICIGALLGPTLLVLCLGACGFTLRGTQQLPFATIYLNFPPNSPLGTELARNIRTGTSTQIETDATKAAAALDLIGENRDRQVLTLDAQ